MSYTQPNTRAVLEIALGCEMTEAERISKELLMPMVDFEQPTRLETEAAALLLKLQAENERLKGHIKHIGNDALRSENETLRVDGDIIINRLSAENNRLHMELAAAMTRLIECRSSVKFDLQEYGRFLDRKGAAVNDCDTTEFKRIESLLAAIDAIKGEPHAN